MSDLADLIGYKESVLPWEFTVQGDVGLLEIRFDTSTLPPGIRRPFLYCRIQLSRQNPGESQIIFLEKNALFQPETMTQVLDFLSENPIHV